jgi:hypothetical protein
MKSDLEIKVEKCIDSSEWVWMLLDEYNGVRCDGYEATKSEALKTARRARAEEIARLNEEG